MKTPRQLPGQSRDERALRLGVPLKEVLDFTVPVSPLGPSAKVKAEMRKFLKYLDRYPDAECARLRRRIAQVTGIGQDRILCTNGFHGAIHMLVAALGPAAIVVSAASPWHLNAAHGFPVHVIKGAGDDQCAAVAAAFLAEPFERPSVVMLGNPGFPAGKTVNRETVLALAETLRPGGGLVVVDESFVEFCSATSLISLAGAVDNLAVVRSFSHFHGLTGLRIGYIAASETLLARVSRAGAPLSVNALAQRAAYAALGDKASHKKTLAWCAEEREYLAREFAKMGCSVESSPANFSIVRHEASARLIDHLSRRRIVLSPAPPGPDAASDGFVVAYRSHRENARLVREARHLLSRRPGDGDSAGQ